MEAGSDIDLATNDLGPLAWVLDELRKSLDSASAALRRFVRDTALARGTDMAGVDGGQLRIARQQLHQAVGALEMVGLGAPAHMLRSMEAAVQRFVEKPEMCTESAASKVERAGFALTEYLESVLLAKPGSSVALFPQYRDVQELAGADRVHPADMWALEWRWHDPQTPAPGRAVVYDVAVRSRLDQAVLKMVKTGDAPAARELAKVSLSLAASQKARQPKIFWKICAAYFEAVGLGLLPLDIYVKRAGSRILLQYASLAKGDLGVSDRLAQDLVFFCAQAVPANEPDAPSLVAVREAWGLSRFKPVDYQTAQYGRFDPVLLSQSRKRITAAKETWSGLSGGDAGKLKGVAEQFNLVSDSLMKLHPPSAPLAQALINVIDAVVRTGRAPNAEVAMEVATAVLYLEAAFQDLDPSDSQLAVRTARLAERLDRVIQGAQPEPLEAWMEELYRRVSDRQTMGSVVGELRGTLGELEKLLDQYFRNLADKTPLRDAPNHLAQMRGVLSVLGLDQAAQAVQHMRESVEEIIVTEIDEERARAAGTFDKLGNNLGALGFLIDMLNYQPALAKKLFVYDDMTGELRPLMGRVAHPQETDAAESGMAALSEEVDAVVSGMAPLDAPEKLTAQLDTLAAHAVLAEQPAIANTAREAAAAVAQDPAAASAVMTQLAASMKAPTPPAPASVAEPDIEEDDLLDIFLEEAREVVGNGLAAIDALAAAPADIGEMTTLRRAFHTLKGSSRMVGLTEFGEAAWSLEQVLNTWLADQKAANEDLRKLTREAMHGFGRWVEDIAQHTDAAWKAGSFRAPADALRLENRLVPLALPAVGGFAEAAAQAPASVEAFEVIDAAPILELPPEPAEPVAPAPVEPAFDLSLDATQILPEPGAPVSFDTTQVIRGEPSHAAEVPAGELPADFDFPPVETAGDPSAQELPATVPEPVEIEGIDFASLLAVSGATEQVAPSTPAETEVERSAAGDNDEQVKVIGSLRIGIPLYNVYLNEADEWSRRLATELAEWALELNRPMPDSTVGLAHALAGSSATVGFHSLSDIARALESALGHIQRLAYGTRQHGKAFNEAAEEIRRLLHQFAAGFLKDPNPDVVVGLEALKALDIPRRADMPEISAFGVVEDSDFAALDNVPAEADPPKPIELAAAAAPAIAMPAASVPARAAAQFDAGDEEEGIDAVDAVDPDLFPIFEDEAMELLPQLGGALRQWSARPDNRGARDEVLRALHTLKGSARLAGALRLGELAHRMESQIESISADSVTSAEVEPLLHRFDGIQANFDALRAGEGLAAAGAEGVLAVDPEPIAAPRDDETRAVHSLTPLQPLQAAAPGRALIAQPVASNLAPQRAAANQAVRVRSQLLDRLVNQAGEVMITRTRLEAELRQLRGSLTDLTGNLDRLRSQLRDIELQAETQMQSRLAQSKDTGAGFDPLEFDRFTRV
jgi:chemosensory pili system protein ChpA (sensor histidine kinase/response regulator)